MPRSSSHAAARSALGQAASATHAVLVATVGLVANFVKRRE